MTSGFQNEIPELTQVMIFQALELAKSQWKTLDYLQVFTLKEEITEEGEILQCLIHTQEIPEKKALYYYPCNGDVIEEKIFCIDDQTHHTFLLASEY